MDVNVTQLLNWSSNNHMNVNFKKTKEMLINTSHCNLSDKLSVADVEIERVNVFKLLGVHINRSLKWDDHVSAICVRVRDLRFGTNVRVRWFPCVTYVNFYGLARVAIQGLTWVNF